MESFQTEWVGYLPLLIMFLVVIAASGGLYLLLRSLAGFKPN